MAAPLPPILLRARRWLKHAFVATRYSHGRSLTDPPAAGGLLNALMNTSWVKSLASSRSPTIRAQRL